MACDFGRTTTPEAAAETAGAEQKESAMGELTKAQRDLLIELKPYTGAANVWSIIDAREYRTLESAGLVRITKPVNIRHDGSGALPYFAVKLKAAGREAPAQEKD